MIRHDGPVREDWVVPSRPDTFGTVSTEEQAQIDQDIENETIHKYYEAIVYKRAPDHWAVLEQQSDIEPKRKPTWLAKFGRTKTFLFASELNCHCCIVVPLN